MPLSYCAIDFETANWFRGSPCAVGLARVVDGRIVETRRELMRPPEGWEDFDDFNISLHGITPAMVRHRPRFAALLPEIVAFADGLPFVAHNAAFDMGVIRDACDVSGLDWPNVSYACTLVLARRSYSLLSYSLPWVAEAAGVTLGEHHEPETDAVAAARILLALAALHGADTLDGLLTGTHCVLGRIGPDGWQGCTHTWQGARAATSFTPNPDADPGHPFYGQEVCFTGALSSMIRERAWQLVAERGGLPSAGVTKHTAILVVGFQDMRKLRPGATLSNKARKAAELREKGQPIEILGEPDFVQQLEV